MEVTTTPFHHALAEHRERYNAQFRQVRLTARQLDPETTLAHLAEFVGPVVDAATAAGGDPLVVTDALVDVAVNLASRGELGVAGRSPALAGYAFGQVLPACARFVAAEPRRVAAATVNAVHHLDTAGTGSPRDWAHTMIDVARAVETVDDLLDAGVVAAWRWGLARLRGAALTTARRLHPDVLWIALGAAEPIAPDVVDRLAANPWLHPGADHEPTLRVTRRVGGFRAFGGVFATTPIVSHVDGQWYARDHTGSWQVHADLFGTALTRIADQPAADDPRPAESVLRMASGRIVDDQGATLADVEFADVTSWCAAGNTLALTTPYSHSVLFVARTP